MREGVREMACAGGGLTVPACAGALPVCRPVADAHGAVRRAELGHRHTDRDSRAAARHRQHPHTGARVRPGALVRAFACACTPVCAHRCRVLRLALRCASGIRYECPSGRYGDTTLLSTAGCSGPCAAGYYCPNASISVMQLVCGGNALYCPVGSSLPTPVTVGHYTSGGTQVTRASQTVCATGTYCVAGVFIVCEAGVYGASTGLAGPLCSGYCAPGYYCPEGSTSATQAACGGVSVYCPPASKAPVPATRGWYTAGGGTTGVPAAQVFECRVTYGALTASASLYGPFTVRARACVDAVSAQSRADGVRPRAVLHVGGDRRRRDAVHAGQVRAGALLRRRTQVRAARALLCAPGSRARECRYECPPARYGSGEAEANPACTGPCDAVRRGGRLRARGRRSPGLIR